MLDRIDLHVHTPALDFEKLSKEEGLSSSEIRTRVENACTRQQKRFKNLNIRTNAEMALPEIKQFIKIPDSLKPVLKMAYEKYKLSARSYHRVLKVTRTIADLEGFEEIEQHHLLEALLFRPTINT